jgi:hypothetical protein
MDILIEFWISIAMDDVGLTNGALPAKNRITGYYFLFAHFVLLSVESLCVHMGTPRPGSLAAARLFNNESRPQAWQGILDKYELAVRAVGASKKKEKDLSQWDQWWRNELPIILADRKYLRKEDLVKVAHHETYIICSEFAMPVVEIHYCR